MSMQGAELAWRKASASMPEGNCVQLAPLPEGGVAVRDSKDPQGPMLRITPGAWAAFASGLSAGEFDDLG